MRTDKEIGDVIADAHDIGDKQGTKWAGMTYEQGVTAALEWVTGDSDEHPLED